MPDPASDVATQAAPVAVTAEVNEFESLLQKEFRPKTSGARQAVETAVRTLAEQALAGTAVVSKDAINSIESIIAELDKKLSEQVNAIIHQEEFRALEGTW